MAATIDEIAARLDRIETMLARALDRPKTGSVDIQTEAALLAAQGVDIATHLRNKAKKHERRGGRK